MIMAYKVNINAYATRYLCTKRSVAAGSGALLQIAEGGVPTAAESSVHPDLHFVPDGVLFPED